jgi:hypothetical protein
MAQNCMDIFEKEKLPDIASVEQVFLSYSLSSNFAQPPSVLCHWFDIGRQGSQRSGRRDGPFTGQPNGYVKISLFIAWTTLLKKELAEICIKSE